jgi:glycosyltransferase involved in cell wall biosynthesis
MSNRSISVSVIVPTFNRPSLLQEALESIAAQTVLPREVIVVDDGENPVTPEIVARFSPLCRLIRQPGQGVQAARNAGVRAARAEWIALLDDDDLYRPTYLASCEPAMLDARSDIIACDHRKFNRYTQADKTNFESAPQGYWATIPFQKGCWTYIGRFPVEQLLQFIPFYPSQLMMRRALYDATGGFDPRLRGVVSEDIDFLVRLLSAGQLSVIWAAHIHYRLHSTNHSRGYDAQAWGRWIVFEGLLDKHQVLDSAFARDLVAQLPRLRARAYDAAFGLRRFADMRQLAPHLRRSDWTIKRTIKRVISELRSQFG